LTKEFAAGDGRPGNNQAQNKQFRAVVKALGLNQEQARQLHDDIQDDDEMNYHGLMERAQDLFDGSV
jgi:ATP phosphoribosyltransferase regulatory subunit HisZ